MLYVSGYVFDLIINYSTGLLWLTKLNIAFYPHANNSDKCVWRACNHGDQHGHWHGDEAQQWPSTPRIPWCDPGQVIIDASVTGHCIHCYITETGDWFKELVHVCACVSLRAEVSHCVGYSQYMQRIHALRQREQERCRMNERLWNNVISQRWEILVLRGKGLVKNLSVMWSSSYLCILNEFNECSAC